MVGKTGLTSRQGGAQGLWPGMGLEAPAGPITPLGLDVHSCEMERVSSPSPWGSCRAELICAQCGGQSLANSPCFVLLWAMHRWAVTSPPNRRLRNTWTGISGETNEAALRKCPSCGGIPQAEGGAHPLKH